MDLPSNSSSSTNTTFVHCSAGAFNCSKSNTKPSPIFQKHLITIQDVYGTPGFCFVGSIIGKLESLTELSDEQKNSMSLAPQPDPSSKPSSLLGPSDGDISSPSSTHGWIQRTMNLQNWLQNPELRTWLFQNRLFHLNTSNVESVGTMVNEILDTLKETNII